MGARVVVRIEGGEELLRQLRRLGVDVGAVLEEAALAGARAIAEDANQRAPGPHVETNVEKRSKGSVTVDIGPDKEHWWYRFFESGAQPHEIKGTPLVFEGDAGTVVTGRVSHTGMAARPFLRPALDTREKEATDQVGRVLRGAVER